MTDENSIGQVLKEGQIKQKIFYEAMARASEVMIESNRETLNLVLLRFGPRNGRLLQPIMLRAYESHIARIDIYGRRAVRTTTLRAAAFPRFATDIRTRTLQKVDQ